MNHAKYFIFLILHIINKIMLLSQASTTTSQSHATSTWPPPIAQESVANTDRPHTISSAYERGHQRPALTVYTFQNPEQTINENNSNNNINNNNSTSQKSPANIACRPPLPIVIIYFIYFPLPLYLSLFIYLLFIPKNK
jgi:hypothetical protein